MPGPCWRSPTGTTGAVVVNGRRPSSSRSGGACSAGRGSRRGFGGYLDGLRAGRVVLVVGGGRRPISSGTLDSAHGIGENRSHGLALRALDLTAQRRGGDRARPGRRRSARRTRAGLGRRPVPVLAPRWFLENVDRLRRPARPSVGGHDRLDRRPAGRGTSGPRNCGSSRARGRRAVDRAEAARRAGRPGVPRSRRHLRWSPCQPSMNLRRRSPLDLSRICVPEGPVCGRPDRHVEDRRHPARPRRGPASGDLGEAPRPALSTSSAPGLGPAPRPSAKTNSGSTGPRSTAGWTTASFTWSRPSTRRT